MGLVALTRNGGGGIGNGSRMFGLVLLSSSPFVYAGRSNFVLSYRISLFISLFECVTPVYLTSISLS